MPRAEFEPAIPVFEPQTARLLAPDIFPIKFQKSVHNGVALIH